MSKVRIPPYIKTGIAGAAKRLAIGPTRENVPK